MMMSAFILKCHKMLLMSHFDKYVLNIGYYYHQGPTKRLMDQASEYGGNLTIKCHVTSSKQVFAVYSPSKLKILNFEACGWRSVT